MTQYNATSVGQYIHCSMVKVPTIKDGDIFLLLAVDNYSRYAFEALPTKTFNVKLIAQHLNKIWLELVKQHEHVNQLIWVMDYAEEWMKELQPLLPKNNTAVFNPKEAKRITKDLLNTLPV